MSIAIVLLKYLEPEFAQTEACCKATGLPIFYADRDGVGNMSRAFNDAFIKHVKGKYEFVWFVTNIAFSKEVPFELSKIIRGSLVGAHPAMESSDHVHLHSRQLGGWHTVPFIEFAAPMFRSDVFEKYMLDENLWYYYMDIELCHRLHQNDYQVAAHYGVEVKHTYLRNNKAAHPISAIRKQLRELMTQPNKQYLTSKYGEGWEQLFKWK